MFLCFLCFWFCCVVLVLFWCSFVSFPAPSHKSCGVFQVSVEGHWIYSRTYVLVLQVSLRLFNLDCRYPRDLLQPASKKKNMSWAHSHIPVVSLALLTEGRTARDLPKQRWSKKKLRTGMLAVGKLKKAPTDLRNSFFLMLGTMTS